MREIFDVTRHFSRLLTAEPAMHAIIQFAERVAPTPHPLLVLGETGTGKDLFAEELHQASHTSGAFVAENAAGLDDQLFADALFGHVRGAFTGATDDKVGLIEKAAHGTLFLDEIGDLSIASQIKLLRVIENRVYYQIGNPVPKPVQTRFVFATSANLLRRIRSGMFRPDLYYRLSAYEVHIPPLRRRQRDLPLLVKRFAEDAARSIGTDTPHVTPGFLGRLTDYPFPGNVRELKMLMLKAVTFAESTELTAEVAERVLDNHILARDSHRIIEQGQFDEPVGELVFPENLPTMTDVRKSLVAEALKRSHGNQSKAARLIGLTPGAVNKFISKYEV